MKVRIFKPALLLVAALIAINTKSNAQTSTPVAPKAPQKSENFKFDDKEFQFDFKEMNKELQLNLKDLSVQLGKLAPNIESQFKNFSNSLKINLDSLTNNLNIDLSSLNGMSIFNTNDFNFNNGVVIGEGIEKIKNYSKSYPLDGNDKIKLSDQYGKITVITWDKHEVKVDVQVKVEAESDADAQKALDNVQITDSKGGNVVSFKTEIGKTNGMFNSWGRGNRVHKIEVNYTVYMPAKNDLDVDNSYGSIVLPELGGKIRVSASYSNVTGQNLTNPANDISASYSKITLGSLNGARISCSYSPVDINQCGSIKASMTYGSCKIGSIKETADLSLSYTSLKIEELAGSFKKVNVNSTYSGVSLGVPDNSSFDFDVATTYGGFNYNKDSKVTITEKTPTDSHDYSSSKTYKGYFGKQGSDAKINIRSTYGGVNFK